jgi:hypothetical protein
MVVAVVTVRVVQATVDQVVRMVAVRHRLVPAPGAVLVLLAVSAGEPGGALRGIPPIHLESVLVDVPVVGVVEMPVVQIVHMSVVHHRSVAAVGAVLVAVSLVGFVCHVVPPGSM